MIDNIVFEQGMYGTKAIIKSAWQDSFLKILLNKEINELELNDGKGWRGENVNFLQSLPNLKSLTIIDFNIKSIDAVHCLHELQKIQFSTYSKVPINFNSFPKLTNCGFEWIKGSDSLFECSNLKNLGINRYDKRSSDVFSQLVNLEKLTILNSPIENLQGLSSLRKLLYLSMANLKEVTALRGLEDLQQLEELEIQRCKGIGDISEVFRLNKLKRLLLIDIGDIASIKGIENLKELKDFLFYESTNIIDGDLSPILKLKNLSKISFQNRKHYTHRREDFGKLYI
jgi:hypothetical protein